MNYNIKIYDSSLLMDNKLNILIDGLDKFKEVTIKLETSNFYNINAPMNYSINTKWESMATFLSDENGTINTSSSASIKGNYMGVRSMGLFESLKPIQITHSKRITNLKKLPTYNEVEYSLTIYTNNDKARNIKFKRYFAPKSVMHKDIVDYEWKGRLFYTNYDVPTPTIIVLSGSDGGIEKAQNIAQSLVSYGFNALALSYFGLDGQSKNLDRIPLEYIGEAIKILKSYPFVDKNKIGIYGRSKGAEYSLLAITKYSQIKCAVLNSPSDKVYEGIKGRLNSKHSSWTFNGLEIPYKAFNLKDLFRKNYSSEGEMTLKNVKCPILLISSTHDEVWDSYQATLNILLKSSSKFKKFYLTTQLGHMNTIPYLPNQRYEKLKSEKIYEEVEQSWISIIQMYKQYLL